jgi:nucleoside-specific outer membrane channel protein Tsx
VLNVHPFVAAYLKKGFPSIRSKWFFEHKKWVKIIPRDAYTYLEYHFFDKKEMKLKIKKLINKTSSKIKNRLSLQKGGFFLLKHYHYNNHL